MWESPVPEFEGLDMSQLGTDEAFLRVQQSGEHCTVLYCTVLYCTVLCRPRAQLAVPPGC